jgi:hypothetical protein
MPLLRSCSATRTTCCRRPGRTAPHTPKVNAPHLGGSGLPSDISDGRTPQARRNRTSATIGSWWSSGHAYANLAAGSSGSRHSEGRPNPQSCHRTATGMPCSYDTHTDQCIPARARQMRTRSASVGPRMSQCLNRDSWRKNTMPPSIRCCALCENVECGIYLDWT